MLTPADEEFDVDPDPRLEKFFHIIMLLLGDPDTTMWIERNAIQFYAEYVSWLRDATGDQGPIQDIYPNKATAILQYMVWYDNERARIDGRED